MALKLFAFTADQMRIIRRVVLQVLREEFPASGMKEYRKTFEGQMKEGILDGALAVGGSATLSIYTKDQSNWADSGENLTVEWPTGQGIAVDSGKYLRVVRMNGAWRPATGVC